MYDKAIDIWKRVIKYNPQDAEARNKLGIAYYNKGMYDQAIELWKKAIELNPRYAAAYAYRGWAYGMIKDDEKSDEAIDDYSQAIKIDPTFTLAFANRARVQHKAGLRSGPGGLRNSAGAKSPLYPHVFYQSVRAAEEGLVRGCSRNAARADCGNEEPGRDKAGPESHPDARRHLLAPRSACMPQILTARQDCRAVVYSRREISLRRRLMIRFSRREM
jgi:tetratricopeptide (TPR) repeat protein